VDDEVPSSAKDGTNQVYQLAYTPATGSVHVYLNGLRMHASDDYTITGRVIAFQSGVIPQTGDILFVEYRY
jgi:hypothetical protein